MERFTISLDENLTTAFDELIKDRGQLQANDLRAARGLGRSIHFEMLLGSLILIVTAIFTTLMGPPAL